MYLNSFGVATLILSTHYVVGRGTPDLGGEEVMGTYEIPSLAIPFLMGAVLHIGEYLLFYIQTLL